MPHKPPRAHKVGAKVIPATSLSMEQALRLALTTPPPAIEPSPKPRKRQKAK